MPCHAGSNGKMTWPGRDSSGRTSRALTNTMTTMAKRSRNRSTTSPTSSSSPRGGRPLGQRVARFFIHPVALVVIAVAIGSLVALSGHFATNSGKASAGQTTRPKVATLQNTPNIPPPGSHVTFDATFTGSTLNTHVWNTCYWYATSEAVGCGHAGVYNEVQWYLPTQDHVSDGVLSLVASPTSTSGTNAQGNDQIYPCRSGMVTTDPDFDFTYGYLQVVARIPKGRNTWPALWMLPANHAADTPEIDIMELIGSSTRQPAMAYHPVVGTPRTNVAQTADLSAGWHTFGLNWEPGSLTWYVDGKPVFVVTSQVPDQPMYFLANLAVTNAILPLRLPDSCTATLSIRSVEVWQKAS
jgi:beta-glucanase (GH16 family)